jgi:hypothetical protein
MPDETTEPVLPVKPEAALTEVQVALLALCAARREEARALHALAEVLTLRAGIADLLTVATEGTSGTPLPVTVIPWAAAEIEMQARDAAAAALNEVLCCSEDYSKLRLAELANAGSLPAEILELAERAHALSRRERDPVVVPPTGKE